MSSARVRQTSRMSTWKTVSYLDSGCLSNVVRPVLSHASGRNDSRPFMGGGGRLRVARRRRGRRGNTFLMPTGARPIGPRFRMGRAARPRVPQLLHPQNTSALARDHRAARCAVAGLNARSGSGPAARQRRRPGPDRRVDVRRRSASTNIPSGHGVGTRAFRSRYEDHPACPPRVG